MPQSFAELQWHTEEQPDKQKQVQYLSREMNISSVFAKILVNRNLCEIDQVKNYLNPSSAQCHDPLLMLDMQKAVNRIHLALKRRERVVIYGDYDVDGTAATVLLYRYFKRVGLRIYYFIPDRLKNGYGITETTLTELKQKKTNLIITVDNGITAVEESKLLKRMGMDLIITDHHLVGSEIPEAVAILNPQQAKCRYPFKGLCGTGVAYKLLVAYDRFLTKNRYWEHSGYIRPDLHRDLDLVAFATVADRVPLTGENRYYVKAGLEVLNTHPRPGLQVLIKESNIRGTITPNVISFKLAPKINAVGRISNPCTGVSLLLAHSHMEAKQFVGKLIEVNTERQRIERGVLEDAMAQACLQKDQTVIILSNESWHSGVIGSVAAKVAVRFGKPTIILTLLADGSVSGSIRSMNGFDVCHALKQCESLLLKFGGHKAAAGVCLEADKFEAFARKFRHIYEELSCEGDCVDQNELKIEAWTNPQELQDGLAEEILKMSPFGTQNPEPVIGVKKTQLKDPTVFGNQHLKFNVKSTEMEVFAWDHSDWSQKLGGMFDIAVVPQVNSMVRKKSIQFKALDMKPTS